MGDATLFGQHALAYAVLAYAPVLPRACFRFPLWRQAAQVPYSPACAGLVL
jgi:hypothetical protein